MTGIAKKGGLIPLNRMPQKLKAPADHTEDLPFLPGQNGTSTNAVTADTVAKQKYDYPKRKIPEIWIHLRSRWGLPEILGPERKFWDPERIRDPYTIQKNVGAQLSFGGVLRTTDKIAGGALKANRGEEEQKSDDYQREGKSVSWIAPPPKIFGWLSLGLGILCCPICLYFLFGNHCRPCKYLIHGAPRLLTLYTRSMTAFPLSPSFAAEDYEQTDCDDNESSECEDERAIHWHFSRFWWSMACAQRPHAGKRMRINLVLPNPKNSDDGQGKSSQFSCTHGR